MNRSARPYVIALILTAVLAAVCALFPPILNVAHHYVNFVAIGRSSIKITVLCIYALLVFAAALAPAVFSTETTKRLFKKTLYALLCLTLVSTGGMAALILKLHVPLRTTFYAVTDRDFSFGHLVHSHLYRPVGYLLHYVTHVEVGMAWFYTLENFFHIPGFILVLFYIGLGLFAAWVVFISIAYTRLHRGTALKLVALVATLGVIKSLVDGAFLDMTALIGVTTLGLLMKNKLLVLLPLPFLVADYFLWFTPDYLQQGALLVCLLVALASFHAAAGRHGGRKVGAVGLGLLLLAGFAYAGARIPFFGEDAQESVASLSTAHHPLIPANTGVYFNTYGNVLPLHVTTTAAQDVASFVREHDVYYETYKDSVKIQGVNCNVGAQKRILNYVKIFTPAGRTVPAFSLAPWIEGKEVNGFTQLHIDSCLPNPLPSIVALVKSFLPREKVIIFTFIR